MKDYTIYYKNGNNELVTYQDKATLIKTHFNGNIHKFKREVARLTWQTLTMQYIEDVQNGECHAQLSTADINPYGWRNR